MGRENLFKRKPIPEILLLPAILILGVIFVRYSWIRIENEQSENVLQIARSIEATLPKGDLKTLEALPGDIDKVQYQVIKNTLKEIIRVNSKARFAYIYTKRNGKLYFIADSEHENSKEYSPPGQEYTEADAAYYKPFDEGKEFITASVTDRWGTWRSVFIPIKDEATGKTIAVFSMDFSARLWNNFLLFNVIESSVLIVLLLLVLIISIIIKARNKSLKNEIAERKQAEAALFESKNQKAAILKAIPDLLFVFNEEGDYLEVYTEDDSKLFVPRESLIGKNLSDLFLPEIAGNAKAAFKQSLQSKELVHFFYSTNINNKTEYYEARIVPASENNILTIVRDITESRLTQDTLLQSQERARRQRNTITRIVVDDVINYGDLANSFQRLTGEIAAAIQVERASIWLFSDDKKMLVCSSLFETKTKKHSSGAILGYTEYPRYFEAIKNESRISAGDAQNDPRTSEFTNGYLVPLGISSMLDAGIYAEGELKGVICIEHTTEKRTWYPDEESFASTIASIVAQTLVNKKRKLSEEALQKSEEKYRNDFMFQRSILESPTDIIIFAIDKNYCYTAFTKFHKETIKKIWGVDIQIGTNLLHVMSNPEDRQKAKNNFDRALQGEYFVLIEEYGDKNLHRTFYENYYSSIKNSGENIVGVSVFVIDITGRMRSEEALRVKDWAIESAINAIAIAELTGKLLYVNPAFLNLWGYSSFEEVFEKSPFSFWQKNEKITEIQEILLTKGSWSGEMVAQNKEGLLFDVQVEASTVLDARGMPHSLLASFADITERKKMIASLEDALVKAEAGNRLKTAFMNNISHEVRTPLNGILGFSYLIAQPNITDDEKTQFCSHLETSSNRLLNTINNYMDISLIASGNMDVSKKHIDLQHLFHQLYVHFRPLCAEKTLQLLLEIPRKTEITMLNSDAGLFRKIMSHLLDNAIKFTTEGAITFGYSIKPDGIGFYVKDTGIGIGMESISLIFDSFKQEELSRDYGFEGSGLGLSIAQGLVQLLGGEMHVESVKGSGSKFFFTIPNDEIAIKVNTEEVVSKLPLQEKPVILIAEDDESNLFYLEVILKKKSVTTIKARNGKEAVDQCRKHPEISLVLMDIKMPLMDGLQATREIKAFRQDLPIIACTAFALAGDTKMAFDAGCNDYISKPVTREKLLGQLKKYGVFVQ